MIKLRPESTLDINNLGCCFVALGDYQRAIGLFNDALNIEPAYANALFNLAGAYLNQNDRTAAGLVVDKLLKIIPDDDEAIRLKERISDQADERKFEFLPPPVRELKLWFRPSVNYNFKGDWVRPNREAKDTKDIINVKEAYNKESKPEFISKYGFKTYEHASLQSKFQSSLQLVKTGKIVKKDFFISYRWHNTATENFVSRLVADLLNRGYTVLYDRQEIEKNPQLTAEDFISRACECNYALCILTKEYRGLVENFGPVKGVSLDEDGWLIDEWELLKYLSFNKHLNLVGIWLSDVVVQLPFTKEICLDFRNEEAYSENLNKYFPAVK